MHDLIEFLTRHGCDPEGALPEGAAISHVAEGSGQCRAGSIFTAIKGFKADGHNYLGQAAAQGAAAALVTYLPPNPPEGLALIKVNDTRRAGALLAHRIMGDPSCEIDLVGVTGTNGKTTTVYLLESILAAAGRKPGMISTVVNRWAGKEIISTETTPSGPKLAERLAEMLRDGVDAAAIEVSSHAIDQHRIDGLRFAALGLTNVTQDHLDYHKTMEAYAATKKAAFERMAEINPDAVSVINIDDPVGRELADNCPTSRKLTYGIEARDADLSTGTIYFGDYGMRLDLNFRGRPMRVDLPLFCYFNAMNCLTGTALALAIGLEPEAIAAGCAKFGGAPGRFELVEGLEGVRVIVDYAHTPDALNQLLLNAHGLCRKRLIVVFGCGGDRDEGKRPQMGEAAGKLADELIITNDNPRGEDPARIASQIVEGIRDQTVKNRTYRLILDRREAIHAAIYGAASGDTVVIAGKGHEDYQILGEERIHFDDREVAREAISLRASRPASEQPLPPDMTQPGRIGQIRSPPRPLG